MIRRAWRASLEHVGGFGLFALMLFGALAVYMVAHGRPVYGAGALVVWYVQARMSREKYKNRDAAFVIVDSLEDDGTITTEQASKIRRAIRGD